jgi:hypothetical protein
MTHQATLNLGCGIVILRAHAGPAPLETTVQELPQAAADHYYRGVVCPRPLTTVEVRKPAKNMIHTNQMEIRCTRPIYFWNI